MDLCVHLDSCSLQAEETCPWMPGASIFRLSLFYWGWIWWEILGKKEINANFKQESFWTFIPEVTPLTAEVRSACEKGRGEERRKWEASPFRRCLIQNLGKKQVKHTFCLNESSCWREKKVLILLWVLGAHLLLSCCFQPNKCLRRELNKNMMPIHETHTGTFTEWWHACVLKALK